MSAIFTALGLVFVIEGLALALAPSRFEEVLAFLVSLGPEARRRLGLISVAGGVAIVALVRVFI
ncbi:hypothetical protein C8J27_107131 [Rhodobacter aestuarii]|uniref:DUF2065 domain-containing protein n=1 Tax=Rhodobacter aestuarii TaxID=453582 RepID=A0A1N7NR96_9RHOB|nr:DUF2065 domain-containing protein [Rhodobacter aestuarii]PTV94600.1 hypothetical protein C8J27_107131 [Rhodobacter aestuarii]SIT00837.1 hypothetical protein SAMN05421580_10896 [Rhodobacter aestuarii]